jgi:hypothetical protein
MSAMSEHLDTMVVEAATPGDTAFARLRGRSDVTVWFAPGYYRQSTDERVADKLAQLGKLLWVARMKEYYRFKSHQLGREIRGEGMPKTPAQVARREARDSIVAEGRSDDGAVSLSSVGLLDWSVTVPRGTVARVEEETFVASCAQAAERLIQHHLDQLAYVWAQRY